MSKRLVKEARKEWVPIPEMVPAPAYEAQRALRDYFVDHLVADFKLEEMGYPVLSLRDGRYLILDGNHRIEALKRLGFGEDKLECEVYHDLTPEEEAERFLVRNDNLVVDKLTKFMVAVKAGRPQAVGINTVVEQVGLRVGVDRKADNTIGAVAALEWVYRETGEDGLRRTLNILRGSFGTGGYEAQILKGLGAAIGRYGVDLEDAHMLKVLEALPRGSKGLLQKTRELRAEIGREAYYCVAASLVEIYNKGFPGRDRRRLASWYKR